MVNEVIEGGSDDRSLLYWGRGPNNREGEKDDREIASQYGARPPEDTSRSGPSENTSQSFQNLKFKPTGRGRARRPPQGGRLTHRNAVLSFTELEAFVWAAQHQGSLP